MQCDYDAMLLLKTMKGTCSAADPRGRGPRSGEVIADKFMPMFP
jgi:hypothetical protein